MNDADNIHLMKERLKKRLAETGQKAYKVSTKAGFDKGFIGDFFQGRKTDIKTDALARIAEQLDADVAYFTGSQDSPRLMARDPSPVPAPMKPPAVPSSPWPQIPVLGEKEQATAFGVIIRVDKPSAFIPAPPGLVEIPGAYALFMPDETMVPRYYPGETLYVHPTKPIRRGDFVAVQLKGEQESGFMRLIVKQLVSADSKRIRLRHFNPSTEPEEFDIAQGMVAAIHKIVGTEDL